MDSIWVILILAALGFLLDKADNKKKPVPKKGRQQPGIPPADTAPKRRPIEMKPWGHDQQLPPPMPKPWGTPKRQESEPVPEKTSEKPEKHDLGFEVPTLRNAPAPKTPATIDSQGVYRESGTILQEQAEAANVELADKARAMTYAAERAAEEAIIRAQEEAAYLRQAKIPGTQIHRKKRVTLNARKAQKAVILSEILGSPRAKKPYSWHGRR